MPVTGHFTDCIAPGGPQLPLVVIAGPTGTGKSELALEIAENFNGEIVNCDSLQVFRYFDVGTAKLPLEERRGIPHHLIDIVDPDAVFTAGEYARRARELLAEISRRGRLPILAGGTGFYLRALIDGLFEGPARDEQLRRRLGEREQRRPGTLHRILNRFDHETARKIHPHDVPKVMRALEVCLIARRPVSELYRLGRSRLRGYRSFKIGLLPEREALYLRLDERCRLMFEAGLVDEVRSILARGFASTIKPFESHGYKQALQLLAGELSPRDAIFYAQRNTRRYAKRQITWLRREPDLHWLKGFGNDARIRASAFDLLNDFLHN
jgi:tRNA dimethylallyltransferase